MSQRKRLWRTPSAEMAGARVETLQTKAGQPAKVGERAYRRTPKGGLVLQPQTINQQVEMDEPRESPSSQAAFPVSHLVSPGSEAARQMTVSSGLRCCALLRNSNPLGCLARMLLASSTWNSTIVWLTWRHKATPRKRLLFQLAPSMPRTEGTEFGLWATPNSSSGNSPADMDDGREWTGKYWIKASGEKCQTRLKD